jgi:hypothetical protein
MKRLLVALLAVSCIGIGIPVAQNVTKSVQLSQDPSGPIGYDNQNGVYFPGKVYNTNNQTAATFGTCGTAPSMVGTSFAGVITEGSGAVASCQMAFNTAFPATPYCTANLTGATPVGVTPTPGGVTFIHTSTSLSAKLNFICVGQQP